MNLDDRVACEIARQDLASTYGTDRDGVRLALACMQDELDEALEAFQAEKRPIDGRTWARTQDELVQAVAVGLRALRDLSGLNHGAPPAPPMAAPSTGPLRRNQTGQDGIRDDGRPRDHRRRIGARSRATSPRTRRTAAVTPGRDPSTPIFPCITTR